MGWIRANHAHHTLAAHDFAVPAHFLDRCPDFHSYSPKKSLKPQINADYEFPVAFDPRLSAFICGYKNH
jgi:hypothetical protein